MSFLTLAQRSALNNLSPLLIASGLSLGDFIDQMKTDLSSGNLGISADAWDVDSLALDGGHFARDTDAANGSTLDFAWMDARFWNGKALVTVPGDSLTLSAGSINYIQVDPDGVVDANTVGFATDGSKYPLWKVTTGASSYSDSNVINMKGIVQFVGAGRYTGAMLSEQANVKSVWKDFGTLSATGAEKIAVPPHAGKLIGVQLYVDTTVAANDATYWTASMVNKGPTGAGATAMLAASDANTTKATGGSGLTNYVGRSLTLHGTLANLDVAAGDALLLTLTKTSTAADLVKLVARADFRYAG